MNHKVVWSPLEEKDFEEILFYLQKNWDPSVIESFILITETLIEQIRLNPKQFPLIYKKKNIRKCVMTVHNTLFYRFGKESIEILRLFDNRQDPKKLKFVY